MHQSDAKPGWLDRISPAWFLFLIAPVTAEFLSGSTLVLNPFLDLIDWVLYGCGTILIRELRVRWRKGWVAVFLMSIAYTIIEEGFMLNTLFDPGANTAGRYAGVNWVWTAGMLMVHSLLSIFLPILLAETVFHKRAEQSWISTRAGFGHLALFCANAIFVGTAIPKSPRPGALAWVLQSLVVLASLAAARFVPYRRTDSPCPGAHSVRWCFWRVFLGIFLTLLVGFLAPALNLPAAVSITFMWGVYGVFLWFLQRLGAFHPDFPPDRRLAVASGIIYFWIVVSPATLLAKHNPFPLMFAVMMVLLLRRVGQRLAALGSPLPV